MHLSDEYIFGGENAMIYTDLTRKAVSIMYKAHKDQLDKSGVPYVFHPWHVAEQMADEESCAAALLHDVIEDTDITAEELLEAGISERVVEAVKLLTHDDSEPYLEYVARIKNDPIARAVKLADLAHNSDVTRFAVPMTDKDMARLEKYKKAVSILK